MAGPGRAGLGSVHGAALGDRVRGLRVHWASGNAPEFPPLGTDLFPVAGWGAVALVGTAAPLAVALHRADRWRWPLAAAGWG
ncbi:hypothetical protein [Plantactinospora veratri]